MSKKYSCTIEVKVPNSTGHWREHVNIELRQAINDLKAAVEGLGVKICVRH